MAILKFRNTPSLSQKEISKFPHRVFDILQHYQKPYLRNHAYMYAEGDDTEDTITGKKKDEIRFIHVALDHSKHLIGTLTFAKAKKMSLEEVEQCVQGFEKRFFEEVALKIKSDRH
jgi:hypothetical protein